MKDVFRDEELRWMVQTESSQQVPLPQLNVFLEWSLSLSPSNWIYTRHEHRDSCLRGRALEVKMSSVVSLGWYRDSLRESPPKHGSLFTMHDPKRLNWVYMGFTICEAIYWHEVICCWICCWFFYCIAYCRPCPYCWLCPYRSYLQSIALWLFYKSHKVMFLLNI